MITATGSTRIAPEELRAVGNAADALIEAHKVGVNVFRHIPPSQRPQVVRTIDAIGRAAIGETPAMSVQELTQATAVIHRATAAAKSGKPSLWVRVKNHANLVFSGGPSSHHAGALKSQMDNRSGDAEKVKTAMAIVDAEKEKLDSRRQDLRSEFGRLQSEVLRIDQQIALLRSFPRTAADFSRQLCLDRERPLYRELHEELHEGFIDDVFPPYIEASASDYALGFNAHVLVPYDYDMGLANYDPAEVSPPGLRETYEPILTTATPEQLQRFADLITFINELQKTAEADQIVLQERDYQELRGIATEKELSSMVKVDGENIIINAEDYFFLQLRDILSPPEQIDRLEKEKEALIKRQTQITEELAGHEQARTMAYEDAITSLTPAAPALPAAPIVADILPPADLARSAVPEATTIRLEEIEQQLAAVAAIPRSGTAWYGAFAPDKEDYTRVGTERTWTWGDQTYGELDLVDAARAKYGSLFTTPAEKKAFETYLNKLSIMPLTRISDRRSELWNEFMELLPRDQELKKTRSALLAEKEALLRPPAPAAVELPDAIDGEDDVRVEEDKSFEWDQKTRTSF